MSVTLGLGLAALFAALLAGGASAVGQTAASQGSQQNQNRMKQWIRENYPNLSESEVSALASKYAYEYQGAIDAFNLSDRNDWSGLKDELSRLDNAYTELGEMPELLSQEEIDDIRTKAEADIDKENQSILDIYNQSFANTEAQLKNQLAENAAMFGDYRNQILTNNAMQQQAIAGSARFELDRQQRNAITRGASAAQRLVANINTQLGLQAQSAQQSLETSNVLAQQLLTQRQAQQGIRNDYINAQNTLNNQRAGLLSGLSERKYNYGQSKVDAAEQDRERAYDAWQDRRDDYFRGSSIGSTAYGTGSSFRPQQTDQKARRQYTY